MISVWCEEGGGEGEEALIERKTFCLYLVDLHVGRNPRVECADTNASIIFIRGKSHEVDGLQFGMFIK